MGSAASPPPASGSPGRCVFFIAKKKRRCGMLAKPGATLCGNHARDGDDGARVECEHCKTRVANLAKHLRRCPARLHKVEQASQPYFALDVNAGEDDPEDPRAHTSDATPAPPRATMPRGDELRRLARRAMDACRAAGIAPDAPAPEPISTPPCELAMRVQEAACARAAQGGGGLVAPFNRRHAEQHASIVSHMVARGPRRWSRRQFRLRVHLARRYRRACVRRARRRPQVPRPFPPRRVRPGGSPHGGTQIVPV